MTHQPIQSMSDDVIYCIVPGFLGNFSQGFTKKLYDIIVSRGHTAHCIKFFGHEQNQKKLWNITEIVSHCTKELHDLFNALPKKKIVIIAHSQGCATVLKSLRSINAACDVFLLAPAIYLDEIILPRIHPDDREKILHSHEAVLCKVSEKNNKLLDIDWIRSYETFSVIDDLPHISQKCTIVYPQNDLIPKNNVLILQKKLPHAQMRTLQSNHWFDENESDLCTLAKILKI